MNYKLLKLFIIAGILSIILAGCNMNEFFNVFTPNIDTPPSITATPTSIPTATPAPTPTPTIHTGCGCGYNWDNYYNYPYNTCGGNQTGTCNSGCGTTCGGTCPYSH